MFANDRNDGETGLFLEDVSWVSQILPETSLVQTKTYSETLGL